MNSKRFGSLCLAFFGLFAVCVATASADVVVFRNGDQVTGKIVSADGGKLIIDTVNAGTITVDMATVKTFSTDEPIKIQLPDGTIINQRVSLGPDGNVLIGPGGAIMPQPISLSQMQRINPPEVKWTGSLTLNGLLSRGGGTSSNQFGVSFHAQRRTDKDRIILDASYLYGNQKVGGVDSTTSNNWVVEGQYDDFLTRKFYGYADVRVEEDRVLLLSLRLTPGVGVGYQWLDQPDFHFRTEAGVAYVYQDYKTLPSPEENASIRLAYHVDKALIKDQLHLFSDLQYFPSVQNVNDYLILSSAGIRWDFTKSFYSELKAQVNYNSIPAPGSTRTQEQYILGVGWIF